MTRFFLDTEFIEDGLTIDLISIGVVTEAGEEFYAVSTEAALHRASPWVREHVLPKLPPYGSEAWMTREAIQARLYAFVDRATCVRKDGNYSHHEVPEFWADHADYDWVALCQLFGTMMQLPNRWPKFCLDLKQLSVMKGSPAHPKQSVGEHDALEDARYARHLHRFLDALPWPENTDPAPGVAGPPSPCVGHAGPTGALGPTPSSETSPASYPLTKVPRLTGPFAIHAAVAHSVPLFYACLSEGLWHDSNLTAASQALVSGAETGHYAVFSLPPEDCRCAICNDAVLIKQQVTQRERERSWSLALRRAGKGDDT